MLGKPLKEFAHVGNSFIRNLVYCFKNKNNQKNSQIRELIIIFAAFFTQAIPGMLQITIIDKDFENENKIEITIIELNETHYGNKK